MTFAHIFHLKSLNASLFQHYLAKKYQGTEYMLLKIWNSISFVSKEFSYRGLQSINQPTFRNHSNRETVATYSWVTGYGTVRTSIGTCRLPVPYPYFVNKSE